MSLDFCLNAVRETEVFSRNITHNLNTMAEAAGIYMHLWSPEEIGITKASELIEPLREGLERLKADPEHFKTFDDSNGWGLYIHFVPFVEACLEACEKNPDATVRCSI